MRIRTLKLAVMLSVVAATVVPLHLHAAGFHVGPKTCQECHKSEFEVWEKTKHSTSFASLHRDAKVKDILAAVGGDSNVRRNTLCTQCHYTLEQADEAATASAGEKR